MKRYKIIRCVDASAKLSLYEYAEIAKHIDELRSERKLITLQNGEIVPKVCPFCDYAHNRSNPILVTGFDAGLTEVDIQLIRENPGCSFEQLYKRIRSELSQTGFDVHRWLEPPLASGKLYTLYCDYCGLQSYWARTQNEAEIHFHELARHNIELRREEEAKEELESKI